MDTPHVTVTLRADDARELFDRLMDTPMGGPQWEWRVVIALADAAKAVVPEWMREKATA